MKLPNRVYPIEHCKPTEFFLWSKRQGVYGNSKVSNEDNFPSGCRFGNPYDPDLDVRGPTGTPTGGKRKGTSV